MTLALACLSARRCDKSRSLSVIHSAPGSACVVLFSVDCTDEATGIVGGMLLATSAPVVVSSVCGGVLFCQI